MTERTSNSAQSTLSVGISAVATSLTVASASTFPALPNFRIRVESELMLVTGVASNTFTVTRAIEGTAAAIHSAAVDVVHILTSAALAQLISEGDLATLTTAELYADTAAGNAVVTANAAIVTERSTAAALTNKTIAGASNTLTVRLTADVTGVLPSANVASHSGDVTGAHSTTVVEKVNGATVPASGGLLVTGNVLKVSAANALTYGAVDLAGGATHVTGTLPAASQASQTMTGDVTGTTAASVVAKVNGATVPASGGLLVTGNVPQVSGANALTYAAVNLAGGTTYVTGALPILNGGWGYSTKVAARLTPLDANHLHAWELDDASGNFADTGASASKVSLTATTSGNAPLYAQIAGPVGNTAIFGRSAAGAAVTSNGSVLVSAFSDLPLTNFTLEIWFRSEKAIPGSFMGADCVGADNIFVSRGASEGLGASVRATSFTNMTSVAGAYVNPGVWHHHALVYDTANSLQILYLDGQVVARASQSGNAQWTNGTTPKMWVAGTQNAAGQFQGQLARFRISDIARSQSYLQGVYQRAMLY